MHPKVGTTTRPFANSQKAGVIHTRVTRAFAGASFSGDKTDPYLYNGSEKLWFRGRRVLDAMLDAGGTIFPIPFAWACVS
jgi:hypothetical protein